MADLYTYDTGEVISQGLQGCCMCDQAMRAARETARVLNEPVVLDDDDGTWLVNPDGSREHFAWPS